MIHWTTALVLMWLSFFLGFIVSALMAANGRDD